jgi:transposase
MRLLSEVYAPTAPPALRRLAAVEGLRRTWVGHFAVVEGAVRLRAPKDMAPTPTQRQSPYEADARYGYKRGRSWRGYKVHLTETCDDGAPHLLTHVATTVATAADVEQLAPIQQGLAQAGLLPAQQLVDTAYLRASNLLASRAHHQIELIGPVFVDHQWQARAGTGFDVAHFRVDWARQVVTCPQGRQSAGWYPTHAPSGQPVIQVAFAPADCCACPVRAQCTRAKGQPRGLTLQAQAEHEAVQAARQWQATDAFAVLYARRAGIEGTISQGVRAFGLRRARYRGLPKTHLQHLATAAAFNLARLAAWLSGRPPETTRRSRFAALALPA